MLIDRVRDGLAWRWFVLRRAAWMMAHFRNGAALARSYWRRAPCDRAVTWGGTTIRHPPGRSGLANALLENWYERVYTAGFYTPRPGDAVIDAGANVGLFSLWVARHCPGCRVTAFEPFGENFELLRENLAAAGATSVEARRAALGAVSGHAMMAAGGERSLDHRLAGTADPAAVGATRVLSFAEAVAATAADRVALFKIDIEGSEYDLFRGAAAADLARVNRYAIEYHDHIRPGSSDLIRDRLAATHTVEVRSSQLPGCGMIYATHSG